MNSPVRQEEPELLAGRGGHEVSHLQALIDVLRLETNVVLRHSRWAAACLLRAVRMAAACRPARRSLLPYAPPYLKGREGREKRPARPLHRPPSLRTPFRIEMLAEKQVAPALALTGGCQSLVASTTSKCFFSCASRMSCARERRRAESETPPSFRLAGVEPEARGLP